MAEVGSLIRLTRFRQSSGVWWARVTEFTPWRQYVDVLVGSTFEFSGQTYTPPLPGWAIGRDAQYTVVPDDNEEFLIAQATAALLPRLTEAKRKEPMQ